MSISLAIRSNQVFAEVWGVRFSHNLTHENDGLVATTLLLFPSTVALYWGVKMIFAAKEAVEKKAREKGREEGREEERRRILSLLERQGIELPPDTDHDINGSASPRS